jgi:RimJ/RimL family protein N-acetyltransferase
MGVRRVVAETTAGNAAALATLRRCGATTRRDGDAVHAEIAVGP